MENEAHILGLEEILRQIAQEEERAENGQESATAKEDDKILQRHLPREMAARNR